MHKVGTIRVEKNKRRFRIENNHGHVNGWVTFDKIAGKVVKVLSKE